MDYGGGGKERKEIPRGGFREKKKSNGTTFRETAKLTEREGESDEGRDGLLPGTYRGGKGKSEKKRIWGRLRSGELVGEMGRNSIPI